MKRRATGKLGEEVARDFLLKHGYDILTTNFRCPSGEIDIIARKGGYLVFVEVRTKTGTSFGSPEESVTPLKKEHLIATAQSYYDTRQNLPETWRIDFVAVELDSSGKVKRLSLIENAVSES